MPTRKEVLSALVKANEAIQNTKLEDALKERVEHYKAKSEQLEGALKAYRKDAGRQEELTQRIVRAVKAFEPYERVKYTHRPDKQRPEVAFVGLTSDWQIGEVIAPDEIENFNEYSWATAQRRVAKLAEKELEALAMHRDAGFPINEIHVFDEGDPVSGNIHYELEVTNEFPVTEAAVNAGMLHAEYVSRLAAHAKEVHVWRITGDNHGRMTRKNQFKQGAINNWAYIAHTIGTAALAKHKNVTVHTSRGLSLLATVQTKRFLIKHGHTVKSWMGVPFYGLEREAARESRKRMNSDREFEYMSIGHYHSPFFGGYMIINGALSGTTELDHALGRFAPPSQTSFFVHPKYGVFGYTPWTLK